MKEYLTQYSTALKTVMDHYETDQFEKIIGILAQAYHDDKQIFIAGNGGSAGTANHFVCDFGKNAVLQPGKRRFRILSVSDNVEKITAFGNDIEYAEVFRQQLINLMNEGDVLMVISASGNSPNIVRACEYAQEKKAHIIALAGFEGGKIAKMAEASMIAHLESYEQIEDIHMIITHMIVYYMKHHPELL